MPRRDARAPPVGRPDDARDATRLEGSRAMVQASPAGCVPTDGQALDGDGGSAVAGQEGHHVVEPEATVAPLADAIERQLAAVTETLHRVDMEVQHLCDLARGEHRAELIDSRGRHRGVVPHRTWCSLDGCSEYHGALGGRRRLIFPVGTSVGSDVIEPGDVMHGAVGGTVRQAVLLSGRRGTQEGVASQAQPEWLLAAPARLPLPKMGGSPSVGLVHELLREVGAPDGAVAVIGETPLVDHRAVREDAHGHGGIDRVGHVHPATTRRSGAVRGRAAEVCAIGVAGLPADGSYCGHRDTGDR